MKLTTDQGRKTFCTLAELYTGGVFWYEELTADMGRMTFCTLEDQYTGGVFLHQNLRTVLCLRHAGAFWVRVRPDHGGESPRRPRDVQDLRHQRRPRRPRARRAHRTPLQPLRLRLLQAARGPVDPGRHRDDQAGDQRGARAAQEGPGQDNDDQRIFLGSQSVHLVTIVNGFPNKVCAAVLLLFLLMTQALSRTRGTVSSSQREAGVVEEVSCEVKG